MKKHNHKICQCASCKSIRGEYKGEKSPHFKRIKSKYCINCGCELNKKAHLFNTKRCHSCDLKYRHRKGKQIGKNNNLYKDGRMNKKFYCKDCGKRIWYKRIRCQSCRSKYLNKIGKIGFKHGHNFTIRGKGSKKRMICEHHIDLNHKNDSKSNKIRLIYPIHSKMHNRAYKYLVKIGLIKQYIKYFLKYEINNKERKILQKLQEIG